MNLFGQSNQKLFPEVEKQSFNVTQERIEKLKELFPNIVSDGKIDWKTLKLMLGGNITEEDERYRFTWNGKTKAIQEVGIPTTSTLRPDKDSSKDWKTTENLYLEGDNLEVLKVLQNSYNGKIKMIYIDPPYNTDGDFIYKDNFTLSLEEVEKIEGLRDRKGIIKTIDRLSKNSKDNAKYHTNWLNMMYPRLSIARDLLTDDGIIFISIDDNELHNLRKICDEIFGIENFVSNLTIETGEIFGTKASHIKKTFVKTKDYILVYSKNKLKDTERSPLYDKMNEMYDEHYKTIITEDLKRISLVDFLSNIDWIKELFLKFELKMSLKNINKLMNLDSKFKDFINYDISNILYTDQPYSTDLPEDSLKELDEKGIIKYKSLILFKTKTGSIRYYQSFFEALHQTDNYFSEFCRASARGDLWKGFHYDMRNIDDEGQLKFKNGKKPTRLIKQLIKWANYEKDIIILDFFSGSATTADAVMQLNSEDGGNRKFIMVQIPELSYEGKKDKNGDYIIDEKTGLPEIQKDSDARKDGFNYITEIGRERIVKAGEKLKENINKENFQLKMEEEPKKLPDIGFKTFKIDSSNFNEWDTSYEAMKKAVEESSEGKFTTYKQDRTDLDLVYEIMLKEGLFLTENVEEIEMKAGTLYKIAEGVMYIFLKKLDKEVVKKIIDLKLEAQELYGLDNPTVILNEAYLDTELKCNAKKNFEVNGIVNIKTL